MNGKLTVTNVSGGETICAPNVTFGPSKSVDLYDIFRSRDAEEAECKVIQAAIDYIAKRDNQAKKYGWQDNETHLSEEGKALNHSVKALLKVRGV